MSLTLFPAWLRSAFSQPPSWCRSAGPAIDLVFTGGRFSANDAQLCSAYFAVFSVSLFLWSAQAIYSRAFYAAGNTFVPMVASTIVTVVSLPVYDLLFQWLGAMGLALASDIGIAMQTLTVALLLHNRRMVSLASLDYAEMGRCLLASCAGGAAAWFVSLALVGLFRHLPRLAELHHARAIADTLVLAGGLTVWTATAMWILKISGSALPRVAMRRLRLS
ncbi:MAG: lipid II flippase MurJ [Terracidiphilus sp.]